MIVSYDFAETNTVKNTCGFFITITANYRESSLFLFK